jgi:hypothetical protein
MCPHKKIMTYTWCQCIKCYTDGSFTVAQVSLWLEHGQNRCRSHTNIWRVWLSGHNTVQLRKSPTFHRNIPPPSSWPKRSSACCLLLASLFVLLFNPEDGGDMFLWNVRPFPNYMWLQPRGTYSLQSLLWESQIQHNNVRLLHILIQ